MKNSKIKTRKVYKTKDEAIAAGLKLFEKTQVAKMFAQNADFTIGEMALRVERMRQGKLPRLFSSLDCHVKDLLIPRTAPIVQFKGKTKQHGVDICHVLTPAYKQQRALVEAMHEYVLLGAAYAKKIGSSSVYQWVLALDTLRWRLICDSDYPGFCHIYEDIAENLVRQCQTATNRLRYDMMIDELPSFESLRKKKAQKTARKAKR